MRIKSPLSHEIAEAMREAYDAVSPFIELHTSRVCPLCQRVCCIDRHGTHEPEDLAVIEALSESPPQEKPLEPDTRPCRQLGPTGCSLKRWQRPYRCTWYFCDALLEEMPREDPRAYREFIGRLRLLQELRHEVWKACAGMD
jgi:hypothetical protein